MGIFSWVIFGALAGWVASLFAGTRDQQGCLANIAVGVVGAFLGGFVYTLLTGDEFEAGWDPTSFVVAVLGSLLFLGLLRFVRR